MKQPTLLIANPMVEREKEREIETDVKLESLWRVIIHNDETTPMNFVIMVLTKIFRRPLIIAEAIMWEAHQNGQAIVVALPKTEAESKVNKAHFAARLEGYPLKFTLEKDS